MTDYTWPDDLVPFQQLFYLQPHTGRSESPFTHQQKIYGLSAPRWICRMGFRGGYDGLVAQSAYGPRLDAFLTKLKGGQSRVSIYDFRRSRMRGRGWAYSASNDSALAGATTMTITGLSPFAPIYAGDYVGGDGRPHIIASSDGAAIAARADASGEVVVTFEPPLAANVAAGDAVFGDAPGWFRLASDDGGSNPTAVGEVVTYDLEFIEDI